jgi:TonB family protein
MKTRIVFFLLFCFFISASTIYAQQENSEVFTYVEQMPEFKGGEGALMKFISTNIKYPINARNENIEGRVIVSFVVTFEGKVTDLKVLRDIGGGCGDEALRVLKLSPDWKPGKQNGRPVNTKMVVPINFHLDTEKEEINKSQPQFPGGDESLKQFIKNNLQYPSKAKQKNIEGICKMKVSILPDGTVAQPIIINSLGNHFDKEVLRVFNLMPKKWLPAMNDDKPFESQKEIEFEFKIPK